MFQQKEPGFCGEMADSKAGVGHIRDEPEVPGRHIKRKKVWSMPKGHRSHLKEHPTNKTRTI